MCEHAYSLAQNLDPNSEGRGVLQFKTGLMSVIKVSLMVPISFSTHVICFQGERVCLLLYALCIYHFMLFYEKLVFVYNKYIPL